MRNAVAVSLAAEEPAWGASTMRVAGTLAASAFGLVVVEAGIRFMRDGSFGTVA